jgi:hypothetical protein
MQSTVGDEPVVSAQNVDEVAAAAPTKFAAEKAKLNAQLEDERARRVHEMAAAEAKFAARRPS